MQANDIGGDSTFTVQSATDPANGRVGINLNGTMTYTPDPGFSDVDLFSYTISDGEVEDTADVLVTVLGDVFYFTQSSYKTPEGDATADTLVVQIQRTGTLAGPASIEVALLRSRATRPSQVTTSLPVPFR